MRQHMWGEFGHHGPRGRGGVFEKGGIILVILDLLKEQPRHGYDIIRELEDRSGGLYSPSPGVVYPTLQSLEDRDLVSAAEEGGKKIYSITDAGMTWLDGHKDELARSRERIASCGGRMGGGEWPGAMEDMRWFFRDVARSMRRTMNDPEKIRAIRGVITDAKKQIDEIVGR